MNICACIINKKVPHEVKYQHTIAKKTSQIMKYMYGQDVIIHHLTKWQKARSIPTTTI